MFNAIRNAQARWFTQCCAICGVQDAHSPHPTCVDCAEDYFYATARCAVCGLRLPARHADELDTVPQRCALCVKAAPSFDRTLTCADYAVPISGMVIALKFGHRLDVARTLGLLLADCARAAADERDLAACVLAPVPLAFERLSARGFNQSLEIARHVAAELGLVLASAMLLRIRHGAPQEMLSLDDRRRNVRGAFAVRGDVAGRHIVVIDDVMTSGATLNEIAIELKRAGANRVTNLVVARTP